MLSWKSIELGLERLLELVRADPRVQEEFEPSRKEFFVDAAALRAPLAELRHLEWFLLERPSPALGAIPAQAWRTELHALLPAVGVELGASLLQSIPGAFEVTSLLPSEGLWLRDLFTQGEHPVREIRATPALEVGDLFVGRIFPVGAGTFLTSPAVAVFRNPALVAAVRRDLEAMRVARRGVLRVQQLELEHLFHGSAYPSRVADEDTDVLVRARRELREQGLGPEIVEEILERIQNAEGSARGRVITETLDTLAFETQVDLDRARLLLIELQDSASRIDPKSKASARASSAVAALEAFDRGRAEGKDLDQLFHDLERDLGVDGEGDAGDAPEEDPPVPDFQGVIGALVEEFLWEMERERGLEQARSWGVLRALGEYARDIGVLEELGPTRLLDFSARWLLDESGLEEPVAVESLLESLEAFCRWCEEQHDLPLWRQFGATLVSLRASIPRHLLLRRATAVAGGGAYRVDRVGEEVLLVRDEKGSERSVAITREQATHLRAGDFVRLSQGKGRPKLGVTYPPELTALRLHSE
jgi:hypothetical protein